MLNAECHDEIDEIDDSNQGNKYKHVRDKRFIR
jgi:hypothetical protein